MIQAAGQHSMFEPASLEAARIERLTLILTAIGALVALAVIIAALIAARRRRVTDTDPQDGAGEAGARSAVLVATAISTVIAVGAIALDLTMGGHLHWPAHGETISISVTGHQWWWDVTYEDPIPHNRARTSNEMHIPVGRTIALKLASADVIHSFWAPNLGGKRDLIPGHRTEMSFVPTKIGVFHAPCAEFCGLEHAKMAMSVVVEPYDQWLTWLAKQRELAPVPTDPEQLRGRALMEQTTCATCHTIAGTKLSGTIGPDLTHIASRLALGAGALPNDSASLAKWIQDPHGVKSGVIMPSHNLPAADLGAIVSYLRTLK